MLNRITVIIPEGDGEPDSIGVKLPGGVTVVPDKTIVGGVYFALHRLAQIEDILGDQYSLEELRSVLN